MPADGPTQAQLVSGYIAMRAQLRAAILAMVAEAWAQLTSWRTPDIDTFAATVAPAVAAGQAEVVSLTDAYLAEAVAGHAPTTPLGISVDGLRGGLDPLVEWHRPGVEVWTALSKDVPLDQAVARGARRAQSLAATDLQLAATASARQALTAPGREQIAGYRRVLTGAHSCALCVVASTQRYHVADLMPIHPGCDCVVEPIFGDTDPGRVLDQGALDRAHAEIASTLGATTNDAAVLRQHLIVHDHGELGPVLAVRGQQFTGPAAIPAA